MEYFSPDDGYYEVIMSADSTPGSLARVKMERKINGGGESTGVCKLTKVRKRLKNETIVRVKRRRRSRGRWRKGKMKNRKKRKEKMK